MKLKPGLLVALVLLLVLVGYLGALDAGFVWDDRVVALDAQAAPGYERTLVQALTRPFWQENAISETTAPYFRPLASASFVVDRLVHGANPAGFHLTNVLLHLTACGLLFAVARRFGATPLASAIGTFFFGVAPRLAECVAWISGRTDVLATAFALAAVLAWPDDDAARPAAGRGRRALSGVLFAAAFGAKEVAIVVPFALVLSTYDARRGPRRALPIYLCMLVTLAFRAYVLRGVPAYKSPFALSDRALASLEAIGHYAAMLVLPWRPALQIGLIGFPSLPWVVLGGSVIVLAIAAIFEAIRRSSMARGEAFGLLVAGGALLLVMPLGPVRISVVAADRFLYLPLAGLVVALGAASSRLPPNGQKIGGAAVAAAGLVSLALLPGVNALWADELRLWLAACETSVPANSLPFTSLGNVLYRGRAYGAALGVYSSTIGKTGGATREMATENVANALGKLGRYDEAAALREALVDAHPEAPRLRRDLALSRLQHLDFAGARALADAGDATLLDAIRRAEDARDAGARQRSALGPAARARFVADEQMSADRRVEAMRAWSALLALPDAAPDDRRTAAAYLVKDGDLADARAAVATFRARQADDPELADLTDALAQREAFAAEVTSEASRLAVFTAVY